MQKHSYLSKPFSAICNYLKYPPSWVVISFFAVAVFSIYSNSLQGPFVFDSVSTIERNESIRITSLNWEELKKSMNSFSSGSRPVSMLSFAVNYYFHQNDVFGYHLVNIFIHLSNALLLYFILQIIFGLLQGSSSLVNNRLIPFYSVLLWLVHPLHTQSVNYIVQRMNSMAAMFFLLAFFLYLKARTSDNIDRSRILFVSSVLMGVIAFFTKQNSATLPVFIFLSEWFFFQNLSFKWIKRNYIFILAAVVVVSILSTWYLGMQPPILDAYSSRDFTLEQRVLTQLRVIVFYMSLIMFPHPSRLNLDHDFPLSHSLVDPFTTIISMLFIAFLLGFAIIYGKRERLLSFCVLWFFGNLLIESSVISLEIIFEHRTYLPSTFLMLAVVLVGYRLVQSRRLHVGILLLLFSLSSFWTFERNKIWAKDLTLWLDCAVKSPNKARPYINAGRILISRKQYNEAHGLLVHAVKNNPSNKAAQNNLATVYSIQGNLDDAAHHAELALTVDPDFADAHNNLGIIYMRQGVFNKASQHFSWALEGRPNDATILSNLGVIKAREGSFEEAIDFFSRAILIKPKFASFYANVGDAYKNQEKYQEAMRYYSKALARDPSNQGFQRKLKSVTIMAKNS